MELSDASFPVKNRFCDSRPSFQWASSGNNQPTAQAKTKAARRKSRLPCLYRSLLSHTTPPRFESLLCPCQSSPCPLHAVGTNREFPTPPPPPQCYVHTENPLVLGDCAHSLVRVCVCSWSAMCNQQRLPPVCAEGSGSHRHAEWWIYASLLPRPPCACSSWGRCVLGG